MLIPTIDQGYINIDNELDYIKIFINDMNIEEVL